MPLDTTSGRPNRGTGESSETGTSESSGKRKGIRCPKCLWVPDRTSRWVCADAGPPELFFGGCGAVWNTFDTAGKCPGCGHQWKWTACIACSRLSPHEDWYFEE